MQERPSNPDVLEAISLFLGGDLAAAMDDPALAFRVRIAANLSRLVAGELRRGPAIKRAERERLAGLLPKADANDELAALNVELAERIRSGEGDEAWMQASREHLSETLAGELAVLNPRFDVSERIE
jgi:hypothetical protein